MLVSGPWVADDPGRLSAVDSCLVDAGLLSMAPSLAEVNSGQTLKATVTPTAAGRVQFTDGFAAHQSRAPDAVAVIQRVAAELRTSIFPLVRLETLASMDSEPLLLTDGHVWYLHYDEETHVHTITIRTVEGAGMGDETLHLTRPRAAVYVRV